MKLFSIAALLSYLHGLGAALCFRHGEPAIGTFLAFAGGLVLALGAIALVSHD